MRSRYASRHPPPESRDLTEISVLLRVKVAKKGRGNSSKTVRLRNDFIGDEVTLDEVEGIQISGSSYRTNRGRSSVAIAAPLLAPLRSQFRAGNSRLLDEYNQKSPDKAVMREVTVSG